MPPSVQRQITRVPDKKTSVLDRIKSIGFDEDEGIQILIYGRSGTGKTTLWSSFPKPILALIRSGGDNPGELRSIDTAENKKTIKQVVLESSQDALEITEALKGGKINYKTIVLDHASGLQDMVLSEIIGKPVPEQKTWGLAKQQEWQMCGAMCRDLLKGLLGTGVNVVIVAQERSFGEENTDSAILPSVGAGLIPSLTGWLNTAVDYIGQTYIRGKTVSKSVTINGVKKLTTETIKGEVEYCLRTAPDPVYTTKFRVPKGRELPREIVDPDYQKIIELIRGVK